MRYIGHLKRDRDHKEDYYQFYIYAYLDENDEIRIIEDRSKVFPEFGNIYIYSPEGDCAEGENKIPPQKLIRGEDSDGICVIEFDYDYTKDVSGKLERARIQQEKTKHTEREISFKQTVISSCSANAQKLYAYFDCPDLRALVESRELHNAFKPTGENLFNGAQILLRGDKAELVGPVTVRWDETSQNYSLAPDYDSLEIYTFKDANVLDESNRGANIYIPVGLDTDSNTEYIYLNFKAAMAAKARELDEQLCEIRRISGARDASPAEGSLKDCVRAYAGLCDADITAEDLCARIKRHRNYSDSLIKNLFLCLTQGFLCVLAGPPGTGKSSICEILSRALGLDGIDEIGDSRLWQLRPSANRAVVVQVQPGWSSKRDFIGYYNPLTHQFDTNNRGVYQALQISEAECAAKDDGEKLPAPPNLVILDEANLSQMEYYWSDFMWACDRKLGSTARIELSEEAQFRISDSLRFLATINSDHTTETLSPRLIDRAWLLSLPESGDTDDVTDEDGDEPSASEEKYRPISMDLLQKVFGAKGAVSDRTVTKELREIYSAPEEETDGPSEEEKTTARKEQLNAAVEGGEVLALMGTVLSLCKLLLGIQISPRAYRAVRDYCCAATWRDETVSPLLTAEEAVDFAVLQRVLPHIQGRGDDFGKKLVEFMNILEEHLPRTREKLERIHATGEANMHNYQYFT